MIYPRKSVIHQWLLTQYLNIKFKQRFSALNFIGNDTFDTQKSILVFGNHSTWWDGFWVWEFNLKVLKKNFYCMMLEEQLRKAWFLIRVGCFSVDPGSRSVLESLQFAKKVLADKSNMLLFYPQGKFYSLYDTNFTFNKGLSYLLKEGNFQIVFYAAFLDYSANENPYLNFYYKKIDIELSQTNHQEMEKLYKTFYQECLSNHIKNFS